VTILAEDEGARPLSGGASLVAMMNARLVAPEVVVSLRDIQELKETHILRDGGVRIGAMTRHRESAAQTALDGTLAVVRAAANAIANPPVRNMGTMGGSISLADPGADYSAALVAVGAIVEIASIEGTRVVPANEFFVDWYTTVLKPNEIVAAIKLPPPRPGVGIYKKLARVAGDFATVSVALTASLDGDVSIAVGGCGPFPVSDEGVNSGLRGRLGDKSAVKVAGEALAALSDPVDDVRASSDYRRLVIPRMVMQTAEMAAELARCP
jgi:carbon-monoxide dehydrogenase medium subunit